jgi:hypothetical protein
MQYIYLRLDVLHEGVFSAIILNLVNAMQSSCFLAHCKHACNFQRHEVLFVKYIINALPVDYRSFINRTNIVADFS